MSKEDYQSIKFQVSTSFTDLCKTFLAFNSKLREAYDDSGFYKTLKDTHHWIECENYIVEIKGHSKSLFSNFEVWIKADIENAKQILINELEKADQIDKILEKDWSDSYTDYRNSINSNPDDDRDLDDFFILWREGLLTNFENHKWILWGYYSDYSISISREYLKSIFRDEYPLGFSLVKIHSLITTLKEANAEREIVLISSHILRKFRLWMVSSESKQHVLKEAERKKFTNQKFFKNIDDWFMGELEIILSECTFYSENEHNKILTKWIDLNKVDNFKSIEKELFERGFIDQGYSWRKSKRKLKDFLICLFHYGIFNLIVDTKRMKEFNYRKFISYLYGLGSGGLEDTWKKYNPTIETAKVPFWWLKDHLN